MEEVHPGDAPEVRLAFRCGYLGDRFSGSQMQPALRTVEREFIASCLALKLFSSHREARFLAAGRTDRGVHARAQVFSFSTRAGERAVSALNRRLPPDIWISGYATVPAGFNPRHAAQDRTYRYYFGQPGLDVAGMDAAARSFEGTHDFSRFARVEGKDPVRRVISSRAFREGGLCVFEVCAESYLWHMVRYMASALLMVGTGAAGPDIVAARLRGDNNSRLSPAPPEGLVLWDISYPFPFIPVTACEKAGMLLETRLAHYRAMAGVLDGLMEGMQQRVS